MYVLFVRFVYDTYNSSKDIVLFESGKSCFLSALSPKPSSIRLRKFYERCKIFATLYVDSCKFLIFNPSKWGYEIDLVPFSAGLRAFVNKLRRENEAELSWETQRGVFARILK